MSKKQSNPKAPDVSKRPAPPPAPPAAHCDRVQKKRASSIRLTDEGMQEMLSAIADGVAVVVVAGGRPVPYALRKLASDALVLVDFTEATTGIASPKLFPGVAKAWARDTVQPVVRGAADPSIIIVRSWGSKASAHERQS